VKGTRLANVLGEAPLLVNSLHHQAVKDIAPGFRVAARATDGIVEAIEGIDYPAVGLQFHPEVIFGEDRVHPDYDYERLGIIFKDLMKLLTGKGNQE
jgi:gamma-glutamyl-gamma-aminobutyrate hydrolase PuuD